MRFLNLRNDVLLYICHTLKKRMKVVFMGTPEFAVASLDAINKVYEVVGVVTSSRQTSRKRKENSFFCGKGISL